MENICYDYRSNFFQIFEYWGICLLYVITFFLNIKVMLFYYKKDIISKLDQLCVKSFRWVSICCISKCLLFFCDLYLFSKHLCTTFVFLISDGCVHIDVEDLESDEMQAFISQIKPAHVLAYATGANQIPACGFQQPRIRFVHDSTKYIPAANTCSNEMLLFVNTITLSDKFSYYMVKGLMNGVVFFQPCK